MKNPLDKLLCNEEMQKIVSENEELKDLIERCHNEITKCYNDIKKYEEESFSDPYDREFHLEIRRHAVYIKKAFPSAIFYKESDREFRVKIKGYWFSVSGILHPSIYGANTYFSIQSLIEKFKD
jgi:hypothetical protein